MDVTLIGRLANDPELRFTPAGKAVVSLTIVTSDRRKNGDDWEDVNTTFWRCTAWDPIAERVAETLQKGDAVIASGTVATDSWEDRETGGKRTALKVTLKAVGPDLRWMQAKANRAQRSSGGSAAPAEDPWAAPSRPQDDEPPF